MSAIAPTMPFITNLTINFIGNTNSIPNIYTAATAKKIANIDNKSICGIISPPKPLTCYNILDTSLNYYRKIRQPKIRFLYFYLLLVSTDIRTLS